MARRILLSVVLVPALALTVWADFLHALPFFLFTLALSALAARELHTLLGRILGGEEARRLKAGFLVPAPLFLSFAYASTLAGAGGSALPWAAGAVALFILVVPPAALRGSGAVRTLPAALRGAGAVRFEAGRVAAGRPPPGRIGFYLGRSLLLFSVFLYSGVLPCTIFVLRQRPGGAALVAVLMTLAWFSDAAAYFLGSFFGKTRGIVRASPNKSAEGYAGAFALTVGLSALLPFVFPARYPFGFLDSLCAGLLVAVFAPLGDLGESALKRRAGVKDASKLLPAFGGVLDIFDSVLSCAPFYLLLSSVVL